MKSFFVLTGLNVTVTSESDIRDYMAVDDDGMSSTDGFFVTDLCHRECVYLE